MSGGSSFMNGQLKMNHVLKCINPTTTVHQEIQTEF